METQGESSAAPATATELGKRKLCSLEELQVLYARKVTAVKRQLAARKVLATLWDQYELAEDQNTKDMIDERHDKIEDDIIALREYDRNVKSIDDLMPECLDDTYVIHGDFDRPYGFPRTEILPCSEGFFRDHAALPSVDRAACVAAAAALIAGALKEASVKAQATAVVSDAVIVIADEKDAEEAATRSAPVVSSDDAIGYTCNGKQP